MAEAPVVVEFTPCQPCMKEAWRLFLLYGKAAVLTLIELGVYSYCEPCRNRLVGAVIDALR